MLRRHWITVATTIVLGTGIGLAVPRLAAVGQSSPPSSPPAAMVRIHDGTLVARGAAVDVPVTVTCPAIPTSSVVPGFDNLSVQVIERSGNGVAEGFGSPSTLPCDGTSHTLTVTVTDSGARPFKNGEAFGTATLQLCTFAGPVPCTTATDSREIRITR